MEVLDFIHILIHSMEWTLHWVHSSFSPLIHNSPSSRVDDPFIGSSTHGHTLSLNPLLFLPLFLLQSRISLGNEHLTHPSSVQSPLSNYNLDVVRIKGMAVLWCVDTWTLLSNLRLFLWSKQVKEGLQREDKQYLVWSCPREGRERGGERDQSESSLVIHLLQSSKG